MIGGNILDNAREIRLIELYKAALENKEKADENAKEAGRILEEAKKQLINEMILSEDMDVLHDGLVYSLANKTRYTKVGGCDEEEFFEALREHGLGDIIKPSVNANTLSSAVRELALENAARLAQESREQVQGELEPVLPDGLQGYINEYNYWDIPKPKAPSKAKLKLIEKARKAKENI